MKLFLLVLNFFILNLQFAHTTHEIEKMKLAVASSKLQGLATR